MNKSGFGRLAKNAIVTTTLACAALAAGAIGTSVPPTSPLQVTMLVVMSAQGGAGTIGFGVGTVEAGAGITALTRAM